MKISKLLFALVIGATLASCTKYGENHHAVSQAAKNAFMVGYPGATDAKWEAEGDMFEVSFKYNYTDYEVTYDKGGYIVEIEYGIENKFLPAGVLEKVEAKYAGKKISAKYVEYRRFAFYEVEISENAHHGEGEEHAEEGHEIEMYFTIAGEEFDGKKKVACIEKCHGTICAPKKDCHGKKSCSGENKAQCKGKEEKKCCDGEKADCPGHANGEHKEGEKCCEDGSCEKCQKKHAHAEGGHGDDHHDGDHH